MFAWYLAAYLPVGLPVLKEAWESILQKDIFSEFTLMSIATLGAFYIKEYPEGVAVMLFYSLGELFQERAVSKAKRNISALIDVRPETATVIKGNEAVVTSPRHVFRWMEKCWMKLPPSTLPHSQAKAYRAPSVKAGKSLPE